MLSYTDMINKCTKCSFSRHQRDQTLFSGLWRDEPGSSSAHQLPWSFVQFLSALFIRPSAFVCSGRSERGIWLFWTHESVRKAKRKVDTEVIRILAPSACSMQTLLTFCFKSPLGGRSIAIMERDLAPSAHKCLRYKAAEQKWLIKYILAVKSFPVVCRFALSNELCIIRPQVPRKHNRNINGVFVCFTVCTELKKKNCFGHIWGKACFR